MNTETVEKLSELLKNKANYTASLCRLMNPKDKIIVCVGGIFQNSALGMPDNLITDLTKIAKERLENELAKIEGEINNLSCE